MTNKLIRVLLGPFKKTAADFLARVTAVYAGLNLNPAYPNPPIPMSVFRTAIDDFAAAATAALDGSAKALAQRNALGDTLRSMVRQLAHYVEAGSNGDMTTFLSSGFQPIIPITRAKSQPVSEAIRKIVHGLSGQLLVSLVSVPGAVSYELRWTAAAPGGTPEKWTNQLVATIRPPTPVSGLTPGTTYVFQARALSSSGVTDWSNPVSRICN